MSRLMCYRCFWPQAQCWCGSIQPMPTRTRFVFLMSPKEFKSEKGGTGRLTHLCLPNSRLRMGENFDRDEEVQALIRDPANYPVLLYPGKEAINLSTTNDPQVSAFRSQVSGRTLVVFLIDATWGGARKLLRLSPSLQRLPRIMFTPTAPSRFLTKQQPQEGCLSTLEAVHELLVVLERAGLDAYTRPAQLLDLFSRMQQFLISCAADPNRPGYRRRPYKTPEERLGSEGYQSKRRMKFLKVEPGQGAAARQTTTTTPTSAHG
jgi:DTW domain-containing protein